MGTAHPDDCLQVSKFAFECNKSRTHSLTRSLKRSLTRLVGVFDAIRAQRASLSDFNLNLNQLKPRQLQSSVRQMCVFQSTKTPRFVYTNLISDVASSHLQLLDLPLIQQLAVLPSAVRIAFQQNLNFLWVSDRMLAALRWRLRWATFLQTAILLEGFSLTAEASRRHDSQ